MRVLPDDGGFWHKQIEHPVLVARRKRLRPEESGVVGSTYAVRVPADGLPPWPRRRFVLSGGDQSKSESGAVSARCRFLPTAISGDDFRQADRVVRPPHALVFNVGGAGLADRRHLLSAARLLADRAALLCKARSAMGGYGSGGRPAYHADRWHRHQSC